MLVAEGNVFQLFAQEVVVLGVAEIAEIVIEEKPLPRLGGRLRRRCRRGSLDGIGIADFTGCV